MSVTSQQLLHAIRHPATLIHPDKLATFQQDVQASFWRRRARQSMIAQLPLSADMAGTAVRVVDATAGSKSEASLKEAAMMAYGCALLYLATQNTEYAKKSANILHEWVSTCKTFAGPDAPLIAAWCTSSFTRTFELLRHACPASKHGMSQIDATFVPWVRKVMLPHLFGEADPHGLQWGYYTHLHITIAEARLQFALAADDIADANWCLVQYQQMMTSYVKDSGFTGETLHDSDRFCCGLAGLIQIAELLQNQGIDMAYSMKLFRAVELHAALVGCSLLPCGYVWSQFTIMDWIQPSAWEIALHHFEGHSNIAMPHVRLLLQKIRPCGFSKHFGFDTITHAT